jgi:AcrR family transcriptional regulator
MQEIELSSKERIKQTAIKLFARKGYNETTVRDIVRTAEINISMVSYYFGGKEGILEDIIETTIDGISQILDPVFTGIESSDISETVKSLITKILVYLDNKQEEIKILFTEMGKKHQAFSALETKLRDILGRIFPLITTGTGLMNPEHEKRLFITAEIWMGMLFSGYMLDLHSLTRDTPIAETQELSRLRQEAILKITDTMLKDKDQLIR